MITVDRVTKLVEEKMEGTDMFIVELSVKPGNKIEIQIGRAHV